MSKLKELERRLRDEPDNLGLRITVAGALLEVGRRDEGIELYRSVASAYRDQGRTQQAIAVCRAILGVAPDDARSQALLVQLEPKSAAQIVTAVQEVPSLGATALQPELPTRRSTIEDLVPRRHSIRSEETPLPGALPYHVADPTTHGVQKLSAASLFDDAVTRVDEDVTAQLATRQRPRIAPADLDKIAKPPPTTPVERMDLDDTTDDELTDPRAMPLPASETVDDDARPTDRKLPRPRGRTQPPPLPPSIRRK